MKSLSGLKVIDLTQSVSGPTGTYLLAAMGAEVVKVEGPNGDSARGWYPPALSGLGAFFASLNRNKTGVKVDLKTEAGQQWLRRAVADADILIHNFRQDTAVRLGVDFDTITRHNSQLVYCAITGYGSSGPLANEACYDAAMQAFSGIMWVTGEPNGPPVRTGPGVLDMGAGMFAAMGILECLYARASGDDGPWFVETSLIETAAFFLMDRITGYYMDGREPRRMGSAREGMAPYELFATADGFVFVAAGTDRFFRALCEALSLEHLPDDDRFTTVSGRVNNRESLHELLEKRTLELQVSQVAELLRVSKVPCTVVNRVSDFLQHPQFIAMELLEDLEVAGGSVRLVRRPFAINGDRGPAATPPPEAG